MYDVDKIKNKIQFYKGLKPTRPNYKKALNEKEKAFSMIESFTKLLEIKKLKDEFRSEINSRIELYNDLIFMLDMYIIQCKLDLNLN